MSLLRSDTVEYIIREVTHYIQKVYTGQDPEETIPGIGSLASFLDNSPRDYMLLSKYRLKFDEPQTYSDESESFFHYMFLHILNNLTLPYVNNRIKEMNTLDMYIRVIVEKYDYEFTGDTIFNAQGTMAIITDKRKLVVISPQNDVYVYDLRSKLLQFSESFNNIIYIIALLNNKILIGFHDKYSEIWNLNTREVISTDIRCAHKRNIIFVDKHIAYVNNNKLMIWNKKTSIDTDISATSIFKYDTIHIIVVYKGQVSIVNTHTFEKNILYEINKDIQHVEKVSSGFLVAYKRFIKVYDKSDLLFTKHISYPVINLHNQLVTYEKDICVYDVNTGIKLLSLKSPIGIITHMAVLLSGDVIMCSQLGDLCIFNGTTLRYVPNDFERIQSIQVVGIDVLLISDKGIKVIN